MTLPPIPDDLNCSEAHWKAALDMAMTTLNHIGGVSLLCQRPHEFGLDWRRNTIAVARLLIKCGEVPEPVDPVEDAWGHAVHDIGMGRADIRQAVERYFICTVKS